jgi:uncharacterized membrane protein
MKEEIQVRRGWLKAMYLYTIFAAGGFGLAMLVIPYAIQTSLRFPDQDPIIFKVYGSFLLSSGLIAIPALRSPLKFIPLLLMQLVYKPIWLVVAAIPLFVKGQFPLYVVATSVIFLTYIIGDLIAIPFRYLFSKKQMS